MQEAEVDFRASPASPTSHALDFGCLTELGSLLAQIGVVQAVIAKVARTINDKSVRLFITLISFQFKQMGDILQQRLSISFLPIFSIREFP